MEKRERVERRQRQREVGRKGRRSKWGENMQGGRRGGRKRGNNKIRWGGTGYATFRRHVIKVNRVNDSTCRPL